MTSRFKGSLKDIARASQESARETAEYYTKTSKDERRLINASFFMGISGGVMWYVLGLYWVALGFKSEEIGLIGGIGTSVGVISLFFSGFLADRLGRKRLFVLGLMGEAAALALFLYEKNFYVFAFAYSIHNISGSLFQPSLMALIASKTTSGRLKFLFGLQSFSNQIGLTLSTFTGIFVPGFLAANYDVLEPDGYRYVFMVAAVCALTPIFFALRVSEVPKKAIKLTLGYDKRMRGFLVMFSLQNALIGAGAAFLIPWIAIVFREGMGASNTYVALMMTISNVAIAVGWFIVPKFAELRGSVSLVAACQIASVVPMILIPFVPYLAVAAVLWATRSLLMLVPSPVLSAYTMNIVDERIRASFWALTTLAWQLAYSSTYAISGYLWANDYSRTGPFFYCGALYVLGSLAFYFYFRNIPEPKQAAAQ